MLYEDKVYEVDSARTKVKSEENRIGLPAECVIDIGLCIGGTVAVLTACVLGAALCLGTLVTPISLDEKIVCGGEVFGCGYAVVSLYETCSEIQCS
jgi:hypothetical protein